MSAENRVIVGPRTAIPVVSTRCRMCSERTPEEMSFFTASQPRCAFPNGLFNGDNWNCATASAVRTICDSYERADLPQGVHREWYEDTNYATIRIADIHSGLNESAYFAAIKDWMGAILYVEWYKSRGCTSRMLILGRDEPRVPTESECVAIIQYYNDRTLWPNGHPDDEDDE